MYNVTCRLCGKEFEHRFSHTKLCSPECRDKYYSSIYKRSAITNSYLSSGTVGAISELIVASDMMLKGFAVFRALSPSCYCDLIAIKDNKFHHVEVRTGYKSINGNWTFPNITRGKTDIFGVMERNSGKVYYFDLKRKQIEI